MLIGLVCGLLHRLRVHEPVARGAGLVMRGLRAEAAVLRAGAGLGVDDGAEVNLVAFEMLADAVGPGQQVQNVGGGFQVQQPLRLVAGDVATAEHALAEFGNPAMLGHVNGLCCHG
jgi:hypothetical protein